MLPVFRIIMERKFKFKYGSRYSGGHHKRGRGYGEDGWGRGGQAWSVDEDVHKGYSRGQGRNQRCDNSHHSLQGRSGQRGRGRHPPGLKGKEIGLWYASHNKTASKLMRNATPSLSMDQDEATAISEAIDELTEYHDSSSANVKTEPFINSASTSRADEEGFKDEAEGEGKNFECETVDCFDNPDIFMTSKEENDSRINNILNKIQESAFKSAYKANIEANKAREEGELIKIAKLQPCKLVKDSKLDEELYEELTRKNDNCKYQEMLAFRRKLPSFEMRTKILDLIRSNQVVVLSGETGCGKTTQVPQFVLDEYVSRHEASTCRIVCTQPRRISAISVAERVADERAERLGRSVGYQIRLEARLPRPQGSVLYCTTGIILQWLQSDPLLSSVSHLILDEIHERDSVSDFLICIAKDLVPLRPDLKVILMSATLNAEQFSKYFNNCAMIHIPGFTYPVKEFYLEDVLQFTRFSFQEKKSFQPWKRHLQNKEDEERENYIFPHLRELENSAAYPRYVTEELYKSCSEELNLDLVLALLKYIAREPPGAVLVFLPGWEQISKLHRLVQEDRFFSSGNFLVIPLHSLMPTVNQREVFNRPPQGRRKIIIATNIAETSITIDDIVYVIDGGRIKMKNFDKETNISTLLPEWVTLANAKQRKGRAGRVQKGICYHLFTRARELLLHEYPLPEIQRTRLEEVILQTKILRLGSSITFLSKVMNPPDDAVINISLKMLRVINALDAEENLTPLGFHLARLPMDPLTGKMLLMGAIFSCLGPVLTVAASLSFKDPFVMVLGKEKLVDNCRKQHARETKSDHLTIVNVFNQWQQTSGSARNRFVWENFLSSSVLQQLGNMRQQFTDILKEHKFINTRSPDADEVNLNSDNLTLVKAVITAGLYPNVARILKKFRGKDKGLMRGLVLPDVKRASLHPKSINDHVKWFEYSWFVYWQKIKSSKVFLHDSTMVSNYPLLLFGEKVQYDEKDKLIHVDDFVRIRCDKQVADVIQKLRRELDSLLEYKISHPGTTDWSEGSREGKLLSLILEFLASERETVDDYTSQDGEEYS